MARPKAIYASIPADSEVKPVWLDAPAFSLPVVYRQPCLNWPDLNWLGDFAGNNGPLEYALEVPEYLWSDPVVRDPIAGETHTFCRRWDIEGSCFTGAAMPEGDYLVVITHAADDQYEVYLEVQGMPLHPIGGNFFCPGNTSWRNIKTLVYRIILVPDDKLTLTTTVTNNPQPNGTTMSNPAMFSWIMQVFDFHLL